MQVGKKLPPKRHTIEKITFIPRTNDGPMECSCGEQMLASEFSAHRRGIGLKPVTYPGAAEGYRLPSAWQIKPKCSVARCDRPHRARGFCDTHYKRWEREQDMGPPIGQARNVGKFAPHA
jgi:hypothetical protein